MILNACYIIQLKWHQWQPLRLFYMLLDFVYCLMKFCTRLVNRILRFFTLWMMILFKLSIWITLCITLLTVELLMQSQINFRRLELMEIQIWAMKLALSSVKRVLQLEWGIPPCQSCVWIFYDLFIAAKSFILEGRHLGICDCRDVK